MCCVWESRKKTRHQLGTYIWFLAWQFQTLHRDKTEKNNTNRVIVVVIQILNPSSLWPGPEFTCNGRERRKNRKMKKKMEQNNGGYQMIRIWALICMILLRINIVHEPIMWFNDLEIDTFEYGGLFTQIASHFELAVLNFTYDNRNWSINKRPSIEHHFGLNIYGI